MLIQVARVGALPARAICSHCPRTLTIGETVPSLELDQITLDRDSYAAVRADARKRMLAIRRSRRVQLGQLIALEFENEDTLHYQVQEMVYAENITTASGAAEEIETYRRLLPTTRSVSATLFLEFTDVATVHGDLDGVAGIQHLIRLQVGNDIIAAVDVPPPDEANEEQTYSVHFVRFNLTEEQRESLANLNVPASLSVDHPKFQAIVPLPAELRAQLIADLSASI
jgi:Protein of unknown function (DUF3501)